MTTKTVDSKGCSTATTQAKPGRSLLLPLQEEDAAKTDIASLLTRTRTADVDVDDVAAADDVAITTRRATKTDDNPLLVQRPLKNFWFCLQTEQHPQPCQLTAWRGQTTSGTQRCVDLPQQRDADSRDLAATAAAPSLTPTANRL